MPFFGFVCFWTVEVNVVGKHGVFSQVSEPNHHRVSPASSNVLHGHIWRLFYCLPPCKHYSWLQRQTTLLLYLFVASSLPKAEAASWLVLSGTSAFCPALGPLGTMMWGSEHQGRCTTALQASAQEHFGSLGTVELGDTL